MLNILNTRRSVRTFFKKPVADKDITEILEAAMNAPSAGNQQSWQFIVIKKQDILEKFLEINKNTPKGSPVGILICGDMEKEKYKGFYVQDCAAATQNILLAAHSKGIGSVWTAVFSNNVPAIRKLLDLPDTYEPFSFVPLGYSDEKPDATSRYDLSRIHIY